ncbi:MAG: (d)CMP kinase [Verrucomicrobiae bacterium]|nr:(d)CMP kinase [Verrucomicrobiae bacterium]
MSENPCPSSAFQAIAIDGPAASGKSTVSRELARKLGFIYVNSGEMYRAVTWAVLKANIDTSDADAVWSFVQALTIDCALTQNAAGERISTVRINGEDPGEELRSPEVNANVSPVASVPAVRELLVARQRDYSQIADIIMEGRDIGSVVFPDTPFKFFVTASEQVREARRRAEGHSDPIAARDKQDSTRKASPLVVADDAVMVDTSTMPIVEVVQLIESQLMEKGLKKRCGCD